MFALGINFPKACTPICVVDLCRVHPLTVRYFHFELSALKWRKASAVGFSAAALLLLFASVI